MILIKRHSLLNICNGLTIKKCLHTNSVTKHTVSTKQEVRVRFAPSPTGLLHLGGLRTALYNYIFARKHGGKFVLRIEDTDQSRIVPGSAEQIEHVLNWAGLKPDESPKSGGPYGPYVQSKRLNLYREHAAKLIDEGKAYRCFCSSVRLDLLRKFQAKNREKIRYDGKCKYLTAEEIKEKLSENNSEHNNHVIRFSLVPGNFDFDDLVFGNISANLVEALESDPIIMKSDKYPTYHFASVVDDHHMEISHVLRGSEWISSTVKHVQLYQAFGWQSPTFAHFPLITMRGGIKMSKRDESSQVSAWIDAGYQPDTLFNFLTQSGGGVPKSKQDAMDFWTLDQLISGFKFEEVTSHPGSLDLNRLNVYCSKELQKTWAGNPSKVMNQLKKLLESKNIKTNMDRNLEKSVGLLIDRLQSLNDLLTNEYGFLWHEPKLTWSLEEYSNLECKLGDIIESIIKMIDDGQLDLQDKNKFYKALKETSQKFDLDYSKLMSLIRKSLTNREKGLPIYEICSCLTKPRLKVYLKNALIYVNKETKL